MASRKKQEQFTIFEANTDFKGILNFKNPLKILGEFFGNIQGDNLIEIGPDAKIEANLDVRHAIVYGEVIGNIVASEKVELRKGASLVGNIRSPKLEVDDGVLFEGQCEMNSTIKTHNNNN